MFKLSVVMQHLKAIPVWALQFLPLLLAVGVYFVNQPLFLALNGAGRYLPADTWAFLSYLGDGLTAFVLVLPFARRYPQLLWTAIIAGLIAIFLTHGLKFVTNMPRPLIVLPEDTVNVVGISLRDHFSFPSGHSLTAFLYAGLLLPCLQSRWLRTLLLLMACLVALSRIMIGAHWPTDILVGSTGGLLCAWLGYRIANKWYLGEGLRSHLSLVVLYIIAAYALLDYDGGFANMKWLGWVIGIGAMVSGMYHLLQVARAPDHYRQWLKSRAVVEHR